MAAHAARIAIRVSFGYRTNGLPCARPLDPMGAPDGSPRRQSGTLTSVSERAPVGLPRITVIIPSFNQARFLDRAMASVLEQDYPALEVMVLDGGSTDGSPGLIERRAPALAYWRSERDRGQTAAINEGWARAHSDVLAWLNSDDAYAPGALHFVGAWFRDHPATGLLYGKCEVVDADSRRIGVVGSPYRRSTMLFSHQPIPQPAAFVASGLVQRLGPLDERLDYVMDYEFFLRAAKVTVPTFVPRILALATRHPDAKTVSSAEAMAHERDEIRRRYARTWERPLVAIQPHATRAFRRFPNVVRAVLGRARPTRIRPR